MYRCKECGAEYEEKPDYCDCGNDEFEVVNIEEMIPQQKSAEIQKEHVSQAMSDKNPIEEKPNVQPASAINLHNSSNSYIPPKRTINIDPISLFIFSICIILSLYVIFFAFNGKEKTTKTDNKVKTETVVNKNIPPIDKIWNNAVPVVKKEEPKKEERVENIIKQVISAPVTKETEVPKKVQTATLPKVAKVPLTKVSTQKKINSAKPTSVATKQQASTETKEQAQNAAEAAAKQNAEQERKAAEAAQLKKLQAEQAKKAAEEKARQTAAAKQEFVAYKAQLRNTIGRKIDFTRVIGDGSCTVAFKIDANGRLINRSFAKQSSNNTLNDAVYAAVMATPTFNPPPKGYNNETLNLNIKFSNGNFEISLP